MARGSSCLSSDGVRSSLSLAVMNPRDPRNMFADIFVTGIFHRVHLVVAPPSIGRVVETKRGQVVNFIDRSMIRLGIPRNDRRMAIATAGKPVEMLRSATNS